MAVRVTLLVAGLLSAAAGPSHLQKPEAAAASPKSSTRTSGLGREPASGSLRGAATNKTTGQESCPSNTTTAECSGTAACLQLKVNASLVSMELVAKGLGNLLKIDTLLEHVSSTQNASKQASLEKEIANLERNVGGNISRADVEGIMARLKADMHALRAQNQRTRLEEARGLSGRARQSASALQTAVRETAREARRHSVRLLKAAGGKHSCEAAAESLDRSVENAASKTERRGEALARRIDDAARHNLLLLEEQAPIPAKGWHTVGGAALAVACSTGAALAVGSVRRRVSPPVEALG